jgi:hypothetical protein
LSQITCGYFETLKIISKHLRSLVEFQLTELTELTRKNKKKYEEIKRNVRRNKKKKKQEKPYVLKFMEFFINLYRTKGPV